MTLRTERPDVGDQPVTLDTTGETSPYPFFEYMRRTDPVFHGSLMDIELLPPELKPEDEWVLFDYDGVFQAFRDDKIFTSAEYDKTIGLVMGHTILAMGGKEHHDHRSLVAKAFRATALERWEPSVIGPVCDQLDRRDQERRARRLGEGADVRVPHPDHLRTARTPARRSRHVPATVPRPDLDSDRHHGGVDRGERVARLLPRPG